jgi:hypothetical protein
VRDTAGRDGEHEGPPEEEDKILFTGRVLKNLLEMNFFTEQESGGSHHPLSSFYGCGVGVFSRQPKEREQLASYRKISGPDVLVPTGMAAMASTCARSTQLAAKIATAGKTPELARSEAAKGGPFPKNKEAFRVALFGSRIGWNFWSCLPTRIWDVPALPGSFWTLVSDPRRLLLVSERGWVLWSASAR